jgi:hypothetical protein
MVTLDQALDIIQKLSPEQQEMLLEILHHRQIEFQRDAIAKDTQQSMADFQAGKLKPQTADSVIAELRQSLNMSEP